MRRDVKEEDLARRGAFPLVPTQPAGVFGRFHDREAERSAPGRLVDEEEDVECAVRIANPQREEALLIRAKVLPEPGEDEIDRCVDRACEKVKRSDVRFAADLEAPIHIRDRRRLE
jgi:hypothetical protein